MNLTVNTSRLAQVVATNLTPITGASVLAVLNGTSLQLEPSDAFTIGDALKEAARKAGYTPPA